MNFKIKTEQGSTYLELPCREERIAEFCKAVGIPNTSATEVAVEGVYPSDRANILLQDKTFNLDKLNYLAKRLDSFDGNEMITFYAVAYGEKLDNICV
jgi:hypothetical protein